MALCHDDLAEVEFYHHSVYSDEYAGDAIFRALARPAGTLPVRTPPWDVALALSHGQREGAKRRRMSDLLTTKDRIAREYLVAKRLSTQSPGRGNWAQTWARKQHPERCHSRTAEASFLRQVRRRANGLAGVEPSSGDGPAGRRVGCALDVGVCTRAVQPKVRRRRQGAGGPGVVRCPEIGAELFAWFVDSIRNIVGRIPSFLLLHVAHGLARALSQGHEQDKEAGLIPPHAVLDLPKLDHNWLRRWRRMHHVTWRTVTLRFKCSRDTIRTRLLVFWKNVLRVRFLHDLLEPHGELVFEGMDQKPLWFTASSQERTLAPKGARKVAVKENVPMTRARFTAMTRCRWPTPPSDGKELGILFKAAGGGARIRETLRVPPGVLLQFQEKGSYRLPDVLTYFEWILDRSRIPRGLPPASRHAAPIDARTEWDAIVADAEAEGDAAGGSEAVGGGDLALSHAGRRVVYLLDWFAPHLDASIDELIHAAGHAILRIGGHLTGLVQVEDTHAHAPYSKYYKRQETEDAYEQLQVRPDKLPSTSRQTVMDRALLAWSQVDHTSCSHGFVANGIANALDGSEDAELSEDIAGFWQELKMSEVREGLRAEVEGAVRGGLSHFADYHRILEPYPTHAAMLEGQEAFGVHIDEQGDLASDAGSATDDEVTLEGGDDMAGDVDLRVLGLGKNNPREGKARASSHEQQTIKIEPTFVDEQAPRQVVAVLAPTSVKIEPVLGDEENPRGAVAVRDGALALCHEEGHVESEDELTKHARTSLQLEAQRKYDATHAALEAAKTVGGDKQLVDTLQERLKSIARQCRASRGRGAVRLRAVRLQQKAQAKKLRAASVAQENRVKELRLEVKLREAEAVKAREKGREATAAARKEADEARLRAKEQACRVAEEKEAQSRMRLKFAAKLCGELQAYMGALSQGPERIARARRLAVAAAARKEGMKVCPVPDFWPTSTAGLEKVSVPRTVAGGAVHNVMWASPDFAWTLFGGRPSKAADPSRELRKLIASLMPNYFDVLGARYGIEGLLAESHRVLDVAFMHASWRYTKIVGVEAYRCGLHSWPPAPGWEERSLCAEKLPAPVAPTASSHVGPALSHGRSSASGRGIRRADPKGLGGGRLGGAVGEVAAVWETAADGEPVRTEEGFRQELRKHRYVVQPSSTHGANQCLIDSLVLALRHAGLAEADGSLPNRAAICMRVRKHLVENHGASKDGYLSHDNHLNSVFDYLRLHEKDFWREGVRPELIECTVTVFDRFTCRVELVPTEPVYIRAPVAEALRHEVRHVQLALYACTGLNGLGYHYEWIHGED